MESQKHLSHKAQVDLGSFYTPACLVDLAYDMIKENVGDCGDWTLLDSSCGYGSFLRGRVFRRVIGADVDQDAVMKARELCGNGVEFCVGNSLRDVRRGKFNIVENEPLILIGNPPYNDTTSIIRQSMKDKSLTSLVDSDIRTRDLGMSFLLSYDKLKADYVCVLHPLSYLIKRANFSLLKKFVRNYRLIDGVIISSHEFSDTSRSMAFPIVLALYKRDEAGMTYGDVMNHCFRVKEGGKLRLSGFDTIANYVQKYPNKRRLLPGDKPVAKFWTLRDINALKRNRTFIETDTYNTVYVLAEKLPYYCYIDVFKQYIEKIPYYLGNCDVIIDNEEFLKIRDSFVYWSVKTNPVLRKRMVYHEVEGAKQKIDRYFESLISQVRE